MFTLLDVLFSIWPSIYLETLLNSTLSNHKRQKLFFKIPAMSAVSWRDRLLCLNRVPIAETRSIHWTALVCLTNWSSSHTTPLVSCWGWRLGNLLWIFLASVSTASHYGPRKLEAVLREKITSLFLIAYRLHAQFLHSLHCSTYKS